MTEFSDTFDPDAHPHLPPPDDDSVIDLDRHPLPIDHGDPDLLYDDRNHDGVADVIYRDVDHDGRIDDVIYEPLHPGEVAVIHTETGAFGDVPDGMGDAIDTDGDGDLDKVVMDPVDGRSLVLEDTNGDHVADRHSHVQVGLHDV